MNLHEHLNLTHSDIKPENILVRRLAQGDPPFEAVLTDFGLSYNAEQDYRAQPRSPPLQGTKEFMVLPATDYRRWESKDAHIAGEERKKIDVFALSVTLAEKIRPKLVPWLEHCFHVVREGERPEIDPLCIDETQREVLKNGADSSDAVENFLRWGMTLDSRDRPTSRQWLQGLGDLVQGTKTKFGTVASSAPLPDPSVAKTEAKPSVNATTARLAPPVPRRPTLRGEHPPAVSPQELPRLDPKTRQRVFEIFPGESLDARAKRALFTNEATLNQLMNLAIRQIEANAKPNAKDKGPSSLSARLRKFFVRGKPADQTAEAQSAGDEGRYLEDACRHCMIMIHSSIKRTNYDSCTICYETLHEVAGVSGP